MFRSLLGSPIKTEILVLEECPYLCKISGQRDVVYRRCVQVVNYLTFCIQHFQSLISSKRNITLDSNFVELMGFLLILKFELDYIRISKLRGNVMVRSHRHTVCNLEN